MAPLTLVTEGSATIEAARPKIVSREMGVFYNPAMKLNRDLSILLLRALGRTELQVCDPLAGSGVRAIRFLKELPKTTILNITINDKDRGAVRRIKENLRRNDISFTELSREEFQNASLKTEGPGRKGRDGRKGDGGRKKVERDRVIVTALGADGLLLASNGYDYIDIDPFGSPNSFLDAAAKRISRKGILAVTATDTSGLAASHPAACRRKYWAEPVKGPAKHEGGLRILIRKCQLVGAQHVKALTPVLAYHQEHYYRIFFSIEKGKGKVDKILESHGSWPQFPHAGPFWLGPLADEKLITKMLKALPKMSGMDGDAVLSKGEERRIERLLGELVAECGFKTMPYYLFLNDLNRTLGKKGCRKFGREEILKILGKNASPTHLDANAIKSAKDEREVLQILERHARKNK